MDLSEIKIGRADELKCSVCGEYDKPNHYVTETAIAMGTHRMCFRCNFWRGQLELDKASKRTWAIIDGHHYVLGDHGAFRGYSGRNFKIKFNNGTILETDDLWHQGKIPEKWKDKFPNNAEFI